MKHKPESWNVASSNSTSTVRRSLTRAGLQLGQLSHVVSGALSTLQGGASSRGAAQNRMRALLSQDRALLSHRACGQALLELDDEADEALEAAELAVQGRKSRGAAQNRMRELLNQDRALLALREARRREEPGAEPDDDDFAAELVKLVEREWAPASAPGEPGEPGAQDPQDAHLARGSCVGATTSFAGEPSTSSVCTPGPAESVMTPTVMTPVVGPAEVPKPSVAEVAAEPAAPSARSGGAGGDPIRTRGMAKLLALQGYRDRALSIYDELLAAEPGNTELRAEADRLRS